MGNGASVEHDVSLDTAQRLAGQHFNAAEWHAAEKNANGEVVRDAWNARVDMWVRRHAKDTTDQGSRSRPTTSSSAFSNYTTCSSSSRLSAIEDVFLQLDKDKSGSIDTTELRDLATMLGETWDDQELREAMRSLDVDGNGTISFGEFIAWWEEEDDEDDEDSSDSSDGESVAEADAEGELAPPPQLSPAQTRKSGEHTDGASLAGGAARVYPIRSGEAPVLGEGDYAPIEAALRNAYVAAGQNDSKVPGVIARLRAKVVTINQIQKIFWLKYKISLPDFLPLGTV